MGRCLPGAQTRVGARLEFDELVLGIGTPATYRDTAPRGPYFLTSSWPVKPVNLPISPEVPPRGLSAIDQTTDVVVTTLKSVHSGGQIQLKVRMRPEGKSLKVLREGLLACLTRLACARI